MSTNFFIWFSESSNDPAIALEEQNPQDTESQDDLMPNVDHLVSDEALNKSPTRGTFY